MKSEPVVGIQPSILKWARESIGMSVEEVASKLKRSPADVLGWESGTASPTYVQLENLAYKILKRPLAIFFLPAPPEEAQTAREFRTLPDADLLTLQADTHFQIRRARVYQLTLKELFEGRNPSESRLWQEVALKPDRSVASQAEAVRKALGISLDRQISWKSDETALKGWREAIEDRGVFIFKAPFKQKEISGFCLQDAEFPLIYINNSSTKTRQIFSLMHELAHLLLNLNGISKYDEAYVDQLPLRRRRIERFCNQIAAEILIPSDDFNAQIKHFPRNVETVPDHLIGEIASRYGVSREAVLRHLFDQGRVRKTFYEQKAKFWASQKKSRGGGGDWFASQTSYLSKRFAREVIGRHYRNQISVEQAAEFLGINAKNFAELEQRIVQGATA